MTPAVHEAGGLIVAQLWHTGRASHPDFHGGQLPVAPSAVPFNSQAFTPEGIKPSVMPRELTIDEIKTTIADYEKAAQAARDAGFNGVEVHGANGYLPAQFLEDGSNKRTDENRRCKPVWPTPLLLARYLWPIQTCRNASARTRRWPLQIQRTTTVVPKMAIQTTRRCSSPQGGSAYHYKKSSYLRIFGEGYRPYLH